jgi:hypothetical protein
MYFDAPFVAVVGARFIAPWWRAAGREESRPYVESRRR